MTKLQVKSLGGENKIEMWKEYNCFVCMDRGYVIMGQHDDIEEKKCVCRL